MKNKIALTILLLALHCACYAQKPVVEYSLENRTFESKTSLICSDEDRVKWFAIQIIYKKNTENPMVDGLRVVKTNIGQSNNGTDDLIVFTFTDGTNIKVKSRTGLLPNSTIEFNLTNKDLDALLAKAVISIRYINGTDYRSMTYYTVDVENLFFINALKFYTVKVVK